MNSFQIAKALEECDWSGVPIGNKAIIQQAIEALNTRPVYAALESSQIIDGFTESRLLEMIVTGPEPTPAEQILLARVVRWAKAARTLNQEV